MMQQWDELARKFDELAGPKHGRYSDEVPLKRSA